MSDAGPPQVAKAPSGGSAAASAASVGALIILDTNIVLDVFVFADERARPVRQGLEDGSLQWLATQAMRDELARVLDYPKVAPRLAFYGLKAQDVIGRFDHHAKLVDAPPKADVTCTDADDQKFIDLAVAHRCLLLSKDRAVLSMKKRLLARMVQAQPAMDLVA
jgi:putative PIN family toxin of toxin-antitoxin system